MSITKIGKEAAERGGSGDADSEYERMDVSGLTYAKMHPTAAVGGTPVALRYFPGDPDNEGYDRGFAGLILDDPFLVEDEGLEGSAIFASEDDKGDDYKVVNLDDSETKHLDGTGVDFDGNVFYGDKVDEFQEDRIVLKLTGNAGRSATCALDVHGKGSAGVKRNDDGSIFLNENGYPEYNGALIEHYPDNDDDTYVRPRFARDTQLRPDVEGKQTAVMIQRLSEIDEDYDGGAYWSTVMSREDEDDEWAELAPTTEFDPDTALVRETKWLEWGYPDEDELEEIRAEQNDDE